MRRDSVWGWCGATALAALAYFALPDQAVPFGLPVCSLLAAAVTLWRAARLREPAWWLVGLALLASALGELLWTCQHVLGGDPFPSSADLFYLAAYPLMGAGFVRLVRRRFPEGDSASLIDAGIVTVGASALAWVVIAEPAVAAGGSTVEIGMALAYPVGDLLVLGLLCRLLFAPRPRPASVSLLAVATVAMLVADTGFLALDLHDGYRVGHLIDAGWLAWYGLTAAAAWRPDEAADEAGLADGLSLPPVRFALPAVAALMAPAVLVVEGLRGHSVDGLGVGLISGALFSLVFLRMAGLLRRVQGQARALALLSDTDPVTGVPNRRAWERELRRAVATAHRTGTSLAVAIVDLDHFKRVNDVLGHAAGDHLLAAAAATWTATLRTGDFFARYGGEEFTVLLVGADGDAAVRAAERIRRACPGGETCSVGVAVLAPEESLADLIARADAALYDAKRLGRDRTALAHAPRSPAVASGPVT